MLRLRKSAVDDLLPSYVELAKKFREKYGREMTAEERRLYELTKDFLESCDTSQERQAQARSGK